MKERIILIADNIRSAHNVGSFFRTAEGFSTGVILIGYTPRPKGLSDDDRLPYVQERAHKQIAKTALGAENTVNWMYFKTFQQAVRYLKNNGYKIYAIEQHKTAKSIQSLNIYKNKVALVVGSEIEGLSAEDIDSCEKIYEIPMSGKKESFNVSIAAGIALYLATTTKQD